MSEKVFKETKTQELESDIVELTSDNGKTYKLHHIDSLNYKNEWYVFFQPAEEIEGMEEDEVVIFRINEVDGKEVLLAIEDEALLEEVFEEFCRLQEEEELGLDAEELEPEEFYCDGNCSCCDEECEDRASEELEA